MDCKPGVTDKRQTQKHDEIKSVRSHNAIVTRIVLLLVGCAILLLSDLETRVTESDSKQGLAQKEMPRIALVQHASIKAIEDGRVGLLAALQSRGYEDGKNIKLKIFNAEADIATANAIAKEVTGGGFDLLITLSTVSLQTVASANKTGRRTPHVFGLVTDPFTAGVEIDPIDHLKHPHVHDWIRLHAAGRGDYRYDASDESPYETTWSGLESGRVQFNGTDSLG